MSYLKLMKLLYLADRESMDRYSVPMSDDAAVSMPHGPVLSATLNLMTGQIESPFWRSWISPDANHEVSLSRPVNSLEDLDELSEADFEILELVWQKFGHLRRWEIRDLTHTDCPEWVDPGRSSLPIDPRKVFTALGRSEEQADVEAKELFERKTLGRAVSELI
ncbi:Panacea domain-containing protein [Ectopseudomonas mendocina]|uniref:Panacea domain-containing protein n=1 Tax=Ectopseudomonas mendocina TaxID=300 RepID=UPI001FD59991|nr:Panacea domain-containing protein [Pseudomonas mendocina]